MFTHVLVGSSDLDRSKRFYDATLGALGVREPMADGHRYLYRSKGVNFGITIPIDGEAPSFANGGTIGFAAESTEQVDAFHEAGLANGGTACEDPPGPRSMGSLSLYLAYLRDPDGNKICAMHVSS